MQDSLQILKPLEIECSMNLAMNNHIDPYVVCQFFSNVTERIFGIEDVISLVEKKAQKTVHIFHQEEGTEIQENVPFLLLVCSFTELLELEWLVKEILENSINNEEGLFSDTTNFPKNKIISRDFFAPSNSFMAAAQQNCRKKDLYVNVPSWYYDLYGNPIVCFSGYRNQEITDTISCANVLLNKGIDLGCVVPDTTPGNIAEGGYENKPVGELENLSDFKYAFGRGVTISGVLSLRQALDKNGNKSTEIFVPLNRIDGEEKAKEFIKAEEVLGEIFFNGFLQEKDPDVVMADVCFCSNQINTLLNFIDPESHILSDKCKGFDIAETGREGILFSHNPKLKEVIFHA